MLDFVRRLTLPSIPGYLAWRTGKGDRGVTLALRDGPRFELRRNSSGNNDYGVAYEVFVHDYYNDQGGLSAKCVKLIVDLGANVGFSLLYFLHRYPLSRIIAFEPHPHYFAQAERNLLLDRNRPRVEFYNKAAGAANRSMYLSERGSGSSLSAAGLSKSIAVEVIDIFPLLLEKRIDLLKMDIEGGEYEILADNRFEKLKLGTVVMEWHSRGAGHEDKLWCEQRLRTLGFVVEDIFCESDHGMFWARHR